jgi:O-acetyl-ADP-ribose deacetylase (regulator of RNase III)
MKIIKGDLIKLALEGKFDVIIHGCNCFCTMGAGIARQIKSTFPEAYEADCKTKEGSTNKLGAYSHATVGNVTIINAYTQYDYKGSGIKADYDAIRSVFRKLKLDYSGKLIGYPKIGAGLAGGNWNQISKIINEELVDENHTLVEFKT